MMINKVDNSQSFGAVYKIPNVKNSEVLKFEHLIAPLYRSNNKKAIRAIDAGNKGFFALTEQDAIDFEKYYGNLKRQGKGFMDFFKEDVSRRMYNVVKVFNNKDYAYASKFLSPRSSETIEDFLCLTKEIFKK